MTELPLKIRGMVAHGNKRGRVLGFPTANLNGSGPLAHGVYASQTRIDGTERVWPSVTSYGTRPTFDGEDQRVETHILDFSGDVYDRQIEVTVLAFIRPEQRFESVADLVAAMQGDIGKVRAMNACGE